MAGRAYDRRTNQRPNGGQPVHLPTLPFNRFGYDIEFNREDIYNDMTIDYEALAAHLVQLHKSSKAQGFDLRRVILDPKLQPKLLKTQYAMYLTTKLHFLKNDLGYGTMNMIT